MSDYDLQDPHDLDMMNSEFDMISADEWEEYIELAIEKNKSYKNINTLKASLKKVHLSKYFSPKMVRWALSIVAELDAMEENEE